MPSIYSHFNPCSLDFNAIKDFKNLSSCAQKTFIGLITLLVALIFAPVAIPVFRCLVGRCTVKPVLTRTDEQEGLLRQIKETVSNQLPINVIETVQPRLPLGQIQETVSNRLPINVVETVQPKLPLIKNLREEFGFAQPMIPLRSDLDKLLKRVVTPPKQLLSYALMQRNTQQLMNPKVDLIKLGYTRYILRLSETQTIEVYSSPFPMIAHNTTALSRILKTPLERGKVAKDKDFILNSCEKISTSILQQGIPAFGNVGSIILSVKPSAIAETSPSDANVPLMDMAELEKAYLILRNKQNALLGYLNEIIHVAYLNLNMETPFFKSTDLLHAIDLDSSGHKLGITNKLQVLLKQYSKMDEALKIKIAQEIFGKRINEPIDQIILGFTEQCEQIAKCMTECIGRGDKEEWDIFLEDQQRRFGQINHFPLGPIELGHHLNTYAKAPISGTGVYTELVITTTKHQKEEDIPNVEIAAIGVNCNNVEKNEAGELILKKRWKDTLHPALSEAHKKRWRILLTHEV